MYFISIDTYKKIQKKMDILSHDLQVELNKAIKIWVDIEYVEPHYSFNINSF
jgi:hypothetical protein